MFKTHFYVLVPPNIQAANGLTSQVAVKDDNYVIKFSITEDHPMVDTDSIQWWYREELTLTPQPWPPSIESRQQGQGRHSLSDDRKSLTISSVQIMDAGFYTLTASNLAGERNKTVSLIIHGET